MGTLIPESDVDGSVRPDLAVTLSAVAVIIALSLLSPILFGYVLWKNKDNLHKPETKTKIGAMYFGLDDLKPRAGLYSIIFLLRRSLFVAVTFLLYSNPGLQVEFMTYPTLAYVCIISHLDVHETPRQRRIEMMNEVLLVCICYHFIFFADPRWDDYWREIFGQSCLVFVLAILGINTLIIIGVNILAIKRKCYLRKLKKQALNK